VKEETTSTQGQALQTKYQATKLLRAVTDRKCRLFPQYDEITDMTSECPMLAKGQYIQRHDRVCAQLALNICNEMGVKTGE
jgi:hypothetical protein